MLRSTVRIATLVVLVIAAPARAQQVTAVTHTVLIDGNGGEPVPDAVVVIRGSVIGWALLLAAGASAAVFVAIPEYASGRSLMALGILVLPLVIAVAASFAYLRRAAR